MPDDGLTPDDCEMIEPLAFSTGAGIGSVARIGLVVLASDYTVEHEFRRVFGAPGMPEGVDYYAARIRNSPQITPDTLAAMGPLLSDTVDLILPGAELDVVAFACTSASTVLGEREVARAIHAVRPSAKATNPISAAFAAFEAFGAKRIAVLTPYRRDVNQVVRAYMVERGYQVPVFGSFNEQDDAVVGAIDAGSLRRAVRRILEGHEVDAVFVSCTSLRLLDAVIEIEAETGLPVTSSNHALAWHCLRLAGVEEKRPELGRLFAL